MTWKWDKRPRAKAGDSEERWWDACLPAGEKKPSSNNRATLVWHPAPKQYRWWGWPPRAPGEKWRGIEHIMLSLLPRADHVTRGPRTISTPKQLPTELCQRHRLQSFQPGVSDLACLQWGFEMYIMENSSGSSAFESGLKIDGWRQQWAGKCLKPIAFKKFFKVLNHSICRLPRYNYTCHGHFQATIKGIRKSSALAKQYKLTPAHH